MLLIGLLNCQPRASSGPPTPSRPAWPALLSGSGPVVVTDLTLSSEQLVVAGLGRWGVELHGRSLTQTPSSFLVALDPHNAEPIWVRVFADDVVVQVDDVAPDLDGGYFLAGLFAGVVTSGRHRLESAGDLDCMVGRVGPSGELLWWRSVGGPKRDVCRALAFDGTQLWVVGGASDTWLPNRGASDILLMSLNPNTGEIITASTFGTEGEDLARTIAITDTNGLIIGGMFADQAPPQTEFLITGDLTLHSQGQADGFVMELDPRGTPQWGTSWSSTSFDVVKHISPWQQGWLVVGTSKTSANSTTGLAFISRLDGPNQLQWTWTHPSVISARRGLIHDDKALIVGSIQGTLEIGHERWETVEEDPGALILTIDATGMPVTGYVCDGVGPDTVLSVAADDQGDVFAGGSLGGVGPCAPWSSKPNVGFVIPLQMNKQELRPRPVPVP